MLLDDLPIRDFSGNNYSKDEFLEYVKKYDREEYGIYIGTDSQVVKDLLHIVTAVCFHKDGCSGKIFLMKEKIKKQKCPTLRSRMLLEAYRSLEVAIDLDSIFTGHLEIHLDIGTTIKSKTSAYEKELTSLIVGQGFNCILKPDSWASSSCSDKALRG